MILVLASGSPRRHDLLASAGIHHLVVPPDLTERRPRPGEMPQDYALCLARQKAEHIASRFKGHLVLGADTVVALDRQIFGKPESPYHARQMLDSMRARAHDVVTAIALVSAAGTLTRSVRTRVHMRSLSDEEIQRYVATEEPVDKAGAYAIQGRGADFIEHVEGCYTTVVGLPLCESVSMLVDAGIRVRTRRWCSNCETPLS